MLYAHTSHGTLRCQGGHLTALIGLLLLFIPHTGQAQGTPTDSTAIYEKIHDYSLRHKVTRWIYEGIFVEPPADEEEQAPAEKPAQRVDPFRKYKGKVIRRIDVYVNDPFGYSVDDTTRAPTSGLQRMGNSLHRRTRDRVIKNLLLMEPMERLDPLKVNESERLLGPRPW
ncbi:MAG: hypothetical protein IPP33_13230 [Flavobacteriales bacterium]|nr:hypothetical protein [Flavobacteriales bacterium]